MALSLVDVVSSIGRAYERATWNNDVTFCVSSQCSDQNSIRTVNGSNLPAPRICVESSADRIGRVVDVTALPTVDPWLVPCVGHAPHEHSKTTYRLPLSTSVSSSTFCSAFVGCLSPPSHLKRGGSSRRWYEGALCCEWRRITSG